MGEAPFRDSIIVIDDDYAMRLSCRKVLEKAGYRAEVFDNGLEGLEAIAQTPPCLVVVDIKMPGISGMEVISRVHDFDPNITVVVITGYATIDTAVEAMKRGAYDFLPKPFSPDELRLIVERGLERHHLAVRTQRGELDRAVLRRRFVSFVSHQLQTPLAAVQNQLESLQRLGDSREDSARRQDVLARCLKRTAEMQSLIRDWLLLAQVEGHELGQQRTCVDLNSIIQNILTTSLALASQNGVTLESRMPESSSLVAGEAGYLTALFDNLILNAIQYNRPEGMVKIVVENAGQEVIVSISDTGPGIPPDACRRLFEDFRPGPEDTGLGLAICRKIISDLGGVIGVASHNGEGSTFTVRLPAWREVAP